MNNIKKYTAYSRNVTTIKRYGDNFIKLQTMNIQRTPSTEHQDSDIISYDKLQLTKVNNEDNNIISDEKIRLEESLIRTRRLVFEYAMSNEWDYFCTFTINSKKYDRYDLEEYHKAFSHWLRNYFRRKLNFDVQYILIPEEHKDGAWHEHGLFKNVPLEELQLFKVTDNITKYIRDKLTAGYYIYNCPAYQKKFGYCTFEPVRNSEACAKYITKYITKDLVNSSIKSGHKLYYVSRKLRKAENVAIGYYNGNPIYDFENQYCAMATFKYDDEFLQTVISKIEKI